MRISGWSSDVCSSDLVDIEQHALRALEQDALAPRPRIIQRQPDGPRELKHELGDLAQVRLQPCAIDGTLAEAGAEGIVMSAEPVDLRAELRSEEHTSELQSLMRISYAVICLKKKNQPNHR